MSLHAASDTASVPVSWRLFVPAEWQKASHLQAFRLAVATGPVAAAARDASPPEADTAGRRAGVLVMRHR
ncbi:transposase [Streptomyces sp. CBMA123]|uniref:transposase n=1 Tax=Streptomyces sp. CBMA123 TaxID=1896313 RepID=UPI003983076E